MPYIDSRAAMAPRGVVAGLDELGAAIVGGIAKRTERDALRKAKAEADHQRLAQLAISTGVDPTGKSDSELESAVAGRVQTRQEEATARETTRDQNEGNYRAGQERERQLDREARTAREGMDFERETKRDQEAAAYREIEGMNRTQDRSEAAADRAERGKTERINALGRIVSDPEYLGDKRAAEAELQQLISGGARPAKATPRSPVQDKLDAGFAGKPMDLNAAVAGQAPPPGAPPAQPTPSSAEPVGNVKAPVPLPDGSVFNPVDADRVEMGWRREAQQAGVPVVTHVRQKLAQFPPELRALYEQHLGLAPAVAPTLDEGALEGAMGGRSGALGWG